jgi:hypothetical protein
LKTKIFPWGPDIEPHVGARHTQLSTFRQVVGIDIEKPAGGVVTEDQFV